jgi:hypothetical protein
MKVKIKKVEPGLYSIDLYESRWHSPIRREPAWKKISGKVKTKVVMPGLMEIHLDNEPIEPCKKANK